ncbi:MAG: ABC transporter permease [Tepidimonas sp.]|uniref:ABC transporter permease n=1 Tax=Tepidimonas sp. TaxID=2002775 RepID=UPI00298EFFF1|nr:ABC transporter permease [Tepidimonas sp.]MCS6809676.1 ABC transporter permease [Tepidimonas sp.]MDW8337335.1 ABC transporter permease [Tepidimonas sp.]
MTPGSSHSGASHRSGGADGSTDARVRRRDTLRFVLLLARQRIVDAYRSAGLGALWAFLPQLAQIATLGFILGAVMPQKLGGGSVGTAVPYVVYMLPGVLLWQLFHDTLINVANALPAQRLILKKHPVDLGLIALYVPLAQGVPFLAALGVLWLLVALFWQPVPIAAVGVTLLVALALAAMAYVVGLVWGMVAVLIPDVRLALPSLLQVGFWLTPIVYPPDIIPAAWRQSWMVLHPWYGWLAPVQAAWTGLPALQPPAAWYVTPAVIAVVHAIVLWRMVNRGRKVVLDAL